MSSIERVLLENCEDDKYRGLSHLYQIWQRPEFKALTLQSYPEDAEEDVGINIAPGMEEIPFLLLTGELPMRLYYLERDGMLIGYAMDSNKLETVAVREKGQQLVRAIQADMPKLTPPRSHVMADCVVEHMSSRQDLKDPLRELFARANSLRFLQGKLFVALHGSSGYTPRNRPLPPKCTGAFYGFDRSSRSFVAYDTFTDRFVGYGPVKSMVAMRPQETR